MDPHFVPPSNDRSETRFPTLPILTSVPPARSARAKYGGLFYLGIIGLATIGALVGWFGYGVWSMRDVWRNVYVLHDEHRSEEPRVRAAFALSRDPRVNQRQRWEMCLRRPLPPLARYMVAESLNAEAATADRRGYALTVAKSPGWPNWLRLLLIRPMAYAVTEGAEFPREPLELLSAHADAAIGNWADFVLANQPQTSAAASARLERACATGRPDQELAGLLRKAAGAHDRPADQRRLLDRATAWIRRHHADSARLWAGWDVEGDQLVRTAALKLH